MLATARTSPRTSHEPDHLVVEQAKGVIMLRYGVGSHESLAALARWGRDAHVPLPELAHALVKGVCQGRVPPDGRGLVRWLEHRLRADIGEDAGAPPRTATPLVPMARQGSETGGSRDAGAPAVGHGSPGGGGATSVGGGSTGGGGSVERGGAGARARQWRYASAVHAARGLGGP